MSLSRRIMPLADDLPGDRRLAAVRLDGPRARPARRRRTATSTPRRSLVTCNAQPYSTTTGTGGSSSPTSSATPPRAEAVHGTLKLLDDAGIARRARAARGAAPAASRRSRCGAAPSRCGRSSAASARSRWPASSPSSTTCCSAPTCSACCARPATRPTLTGGADVAPRRRRRADRRPRRRPASTASRSSRAARRRRARGHAHARRLLARRRRHAPRRRRGLRPRRPALAHGAAKRAVARLAPPSSRPFGVSDYESGMTPSKSGEDARTGRRAHGGGLRRRHAAGRQPLHRRDRGVRQRPRDAARLPGRDPRAGRHASPASPRSRSTSRRATSSRPATRRTCWWR